MVPHVQPSITDLERRECSQRSDEQVVPQVEQATRSLVAPEGLPSQTSTVASTSNINSEPLGESRRSLNVSPFEYNEHVKVKWLLTLECC